MLAVSIIHELKRLWAKIDVEIEEGISELALITSEKITIGQVSFHKIPTPRELVRKLLEAASVSLPTVLPHRGVNVATRKKLPDRRK